MKPERASQLFEKLNKRGTNRSTTGGVYNSVALDNQHKDGILAAAGLKTTQGEVALAIKNLKMGNELRPFSV
jgi:hypothetical protein